MRVTVEQLASWMKAEEAEHLEFKEAKRQFDSRKLNRYCCALANERGGRLILGVTDRRPRRVVGTQAFEDLGKAKKMVLQALRLRVEACEVPHSDGRVVVFEVPSRPTGTPVSYEGAYWMRVSDSLVAMTPDHLRRVFNEGETDFSAEVCPGASMADLSPQAIAKLRDTWSRKARNPVQRQMVGDFSDDEVLTNLGLTIDGGLTYAALILVGKRDALVRYLPQSEIVWEYRASEASLRAQDRTEYRRGFFEFADTLWAEIDARNDIQHFQLGLFVWDIPTFNEGVIREAILNAVSHRDYRLDRSVFIRQYPQMLEVVSPGGFPLGVTANNILWQQSPRNRRIAEALAQCGLVERSGQGADLMFRTCIRESKPLPDYSRSDDYQVWLSLRGQVQDAEFLRFLEKVGKETAEAFTTRDLLVLDLIRRGERVPDDLRKRLAVLKDHGVIETKGRGRGTRYLLSRRFYTFVGKRGTYTRKRGLARETNKALLEEHLKQFKRASIREFEEVLPSLSRRQIHSLLRSLRDEGKIRMVGKKRGALWELVRRPG